MRREEEVMFSKEEVCFSVGGGNSSPAVGAAFVAAAGKKKEKNPVDPRSRRLTPEDLRIRRVTNITAVGGDVEAKIREEDAEYAVGVGRSLAEVEDKVTQAKTQAKAAASNTKDALVAAIIDEGGTTVGDTEFLNLKEEFERLKREEPKVFAHAQLSYLIRRVELATDKVNNGGHPVGANGFLEEAIKIRRFRRATATEQEAAKNKKALPSHTVVGHGMIVVPLELTAANKVLGERLIALVRSEKFSLKKAKKETIVAMKSKATITLTDVLSGKVLKDGKRPVVYLAASAKKVEGTGYDGQPWVDWRPSFRLLLEVREGKLLRVLEVEGSDKIVAFYKRIKGDGLYLPLVYVAAGDIANNMKGDAFKKLKHFLGDVLRGLGAETAELKAAKEVVAKNRAMTNELAAELGVKDIVLDADSELEAAEATA